MGFQRGPEAEDKVATKMRELECGIGGGQRVTPSAETTRTGQELGASWDPKESPEIPRGKGLNKCQLWASVESCRQAAPPFRSSQSLLFCNQTRKNKPLNSYPFHNSPFIPDLAPRRGKEKKMRGRRQKVRGLLDIFIFQSRGNRWGLEAGSWAGRLCVCCPGYNRRWQLLLQPWSGRSSGLLTCGSIGPR